jgi:nitrogen fixation protein FixH
MNDTHTLEHKEKTAQFIWTGFILVFFVIQAIIWTVAITLTARDQSHAVVAGYDEKALHWDDEKALRNASDQLGWQADLLVDTDGDIRHIHTITLQLEKADKSPVADANIQLSAFHRSRAGAPQQINFTETSDGIYTGKIEIRKSGNWQFDGLALAGDDIFLIKQKQHLTANN